MLLSTVFAQKPNEAGFRDFRALRSKKVSEYFADFRDETSSQVTFSGIIHFDETTLEKFNEDFDQLLIQQNRIQGLSQFREFRAWWKRNRAAFLTRPVIAIYKESDLNLGIFLDELRLQFLETHKKNSRSFAHFRNRSFLLPLVLPLTYLFPKFGQLAWNLMLLGPGVQMINSYTQPVITPLAQTAVQKGSQDLAPISLSIQSWLTNREKLKTVSKDLHDLTDRLKGQNFKGMSTRESQSKWAEFEQIYYELFLSYNQALPAHLRDGRNFFRDWMMVTPIWISASLSTFSTQYWIHRKEADILELKQKKQNGFLVTQDIQLKKIHEEEMKASEDRIAGALASWKLFEFIFPEFPKEPASGKLRSDIRHTYKVFVKSMRFDLYIQQFSGQIDRILKDIDAEFLQQDLEVIPNQRSPLDSS